MHTWKRELKRGIHFLSRHDADSALRSFNQALADCPVSETKHLSRLLFYMGITLKRLGYTDSAVKSWLGSNRLLKNAYASKMLKRFSNDYGMARQSCSDLDDWRAFYSIQLTRYLNTKRYKRFCCEAERDMIRDLIADYWRQLKMEGVLEGHSCEEKNRLFKKVRIVFPLLRPDDSCAETLVYVDFREKKQASPEDRCLCGSGLSFMACCGRIPGEIELLNGLF
jgi:hypothetical protein